MFSSALLTLVLSTPDAEAAADFRRAMKTALASTMRVAVTTTDGGTVASVSAEVTSDAGSEDVVLVESDAWLHGTAAVGALPKSDAAVTLTLYDTFSAELATFSGTLDADGGVSLRRGGASCACDPGYAGSCGKVEVCTDVELLAAELFNTPTGYELGIDLNGADTYAVAYATVVVTEAKTTITKAEIGWDDMGAVWEGELGMDHAGLVEVKATSRDENGEKIEKAKVKLGVSFDDGGYGVRTLATDDDPMTSLAIAPNKRGYGAGKYGLELDTLMTVVSTGWTVGSTLPVAASVELDGGATLSIPVNSYQVAAAPVLAKFGDEVYYDITVNGGSIVLTDSIDPTFDNLSVPTCAGGYCVTFTDQDDGTYTIAVSAYADDAAKLPHDAKVEIVSLDRGGKELAVDAMTFDFEEEVTIVFALQVTPAADPLGLDLSGKVSLLDAPDKKGKQKTLAKGKFHGTFTRDGDGDLSLSGADKDTVEAKGDILIGGEPIDFELTDSDEDGYIDAPPVLVHERLAGEPQLTMAQLNLYAPHR